MIAADWTLRRFATALGLAVAATLATLLFAVPLPAAAKRAAADREVVQLEAQLGAVQSQLAALDAQAPELASARATLAERIPAHRRDLAWMKWVRAAAGRAGVEELKIELEGGVQLDPPGEAALDALAATPAQLRPTRLSLHGKSGYRQLVSLMGELSRDPQLLRVREVALERIPGKMTSWTLVVEALHW